MTTTQISNSLNREIWSMRNNETAMRKMLDAARQIRLVYVDSSNIEPNGDAEAERQFRSLRGCWSDDTDDARQMEEAISQSRERDVQHEIILD